MALMPVCLATSAIDHETDNIIQNTLRRELGSDVTVLTIAHRLQTIVDADKIVSPLLALLLVRDVDTRTFQLVLEAGKIVSLFLLRLFYNLTLY